MNQTLQEIVTGAQKLLIIQAENPDGDSLGSALALEQIFGAMGKDESDFEGMKEKING